MFPAIKKSFRRFLLLYILSTTLLIGIGEYLYYRYAYHTILDKTRLELEQKSKELIIKLKHPHQSFAPKLTYPKEPKSALFDIEHNYLIGSFKPLKIDWQRQDYIEGSTLYLITKLYPYYLGGAYLVTATTLPHDKIATLHKELTLFSLFALLVVILTAYFLGRLFVAPANESIKLLDTFIKDATHELNTPISTILTNIELFKEFHPELRTDEEIGRIELAAKRLSKIFEDLAFLQLHHKVKKEPKPTRIDALLKERIDYFLPLIEAKELQLHIDLRPHILHIDPNDAQTIIDNLLSNAIKYNHIGGLLRITLSSKSLHIEDSGIGIQKDMLQKVTKRFFRANTNQGGFGLGLFIVKELCRSYNFHLHIESEYNKGTIVKVVW